MKCRRKGSDIKRRQLIGWVMLPIMAVLSGGTFGGVTEHTKLWTSAVIRGSLFHSQKISYYLEPRLRFIDDKYKFEELSAYVGVGYQLTSVLGLLAGDAPILSRSVSGDTIHENRVWQQADWHLSHTPTHDWLSRTRVDERKRSGEAGWAYRIRERISFITPLPSWPNHSLVLFDEVFMNLNHPQWLNNNTLIGQNRVFVGVRFHLNAQSSVDVGYLNQYVFSNPNQMSHVLNITFNITN